MRTVWITGILALTLAAASWLAWSWYSVDQESWPRAVPGGSVELAWINTATSTAAWQRLVLAAQHLCDRYPELRLDASDAFPERTAAIPQVVVRCSGSSQNIYLRWYKLTSERTALALVAHWARRGEPPAAVIGGGSSDRARDLAEALHTHFARAEHAPVLCITTATAEQVHPSSAGDPVDLMSIYPGRTFRFCFTNQQMAQALFDLMWDRPKYRPHGPLTAGIGSLGAFSAGDLFGCLALLHLAIGYRVYVVAWEDDPYSLDFAREAVRVASVRGASSIARYFIPYSTGSYDVPNAAEAQTARHLVQALASRPQERPVLVLPTVHRPLRRLLLYMQQLDPLVLRHVPVVVGDSIGLDTVYRDAPLSWHPRHVPVILMLFSHEDPTDWKSQEAHQPWARTATDDLLQNMIILETLFRALEVLEGAVDTSAEAARSLADRLRATARGFFDERGNRLTGSGEYVSVLDPGAVDAKGSPHLSVWQRRRQRPNATEPGAWHLRVDLPLGDP
ncbi:MAG: hypothetical protein C4297_03065 [Gemmataceae bacterium]